MVVTLIVKLHRFFLKSLSFIFLNTQCCNIFVLSAFHIGNSNFLVYDQCFGTVMQIIIKIAAGNGVGKILVGK